MTILRTELLAHPAFAPRFISATLWTHEFVKLALLFLGQHLANAISRGAYLLLQFTVDRLHDLSRTLLTFAQNFLDLFPLPGREVHLPLHSLKQIHSQHRRQQIGLALAHLGRWIGCPWQWQAWSAHVHPGLPIFFHAVEQPELTLFHPFAMGDQQSTGHHSGPKNHQCGEDDLPCVHNVSSA